MEKETKKDEKADVPSKLLKIFLIGMMGCGKTYWAEKLKKKLKIAAYDLDNLVEIMEERTIAEIFEQDGEEFFRKEEAKMLRLFKEKKQYILSCGGGTPIYHDNMNWMNKQGITVWIDEPVAVLTKRLTDFAEHRPAIRGFNEEQLALWITEKLEERRPFYQQAAHRLSKAELDEKSFLKILKDYA